MKKLILTAFIAVAAISFASAQWTTTGGFEQTSNNVKTVKTGSPATYVAERTDGAVVSLSVGTGGANFRVDKNFNFNIQGQARADLLAGNGTGLVGIMKVEGSAPANSLTISTAGNVGIGTLTPGGKLAVAGTILAQEAKVKADVTTPDYVFESDYSLRSLEEVEAFVKENKHLPEMPSAAEFAQNGITLGQMSMDLLKKVEELTLYMIELKKENEVLKLRVASLEK